jgi:hypothetical protein
MLFFPAVQASSMKNGDPQHQPGDSDADCYDDYNSSFPASHGIVTSMQRFASSTATTVAADITAFLN